MPDDSKMMRKVLSRTSCLNLWSPELGSHHTSNWFHVILWKWYFGWQYSRWVDRYHSLHFISTL